MATTYSSTKVANTVPAKGGIGLIESSASFDITAALVVNDVIKMVKVPSGAIVKSVIMDTPDIGTGSPVMAVGDGTTADRFITGSTAGAAGGVAFMNKAGGLNYTYPNDDTIDIKITTAPDAGATSGTIQLSVQYSLS